MPRRTRRNALEQVAKYGQQRERTSVVDLVRAMPLGTPVAARYLRLVAEALVPQAVVVRAGIADGVQGEQPRFEHLSRHPHLVCNALPHVVKRALEKREHHTEVHNVDEHPVGRESVQVSVLLLEVLYKERFGPAVGSGTPRHEMPIGTLLHVWQR